MPEEKEVWAGSPSHVVNLGLYIICGLFFWLIVPLFILIWKWLVIGSIRYQLTTERLIIRTGVFNKQTDELELYRVRDYKLEQPFFLRLFSLANITLETSDRSHPTLVLEAIPNGEELRDTLRTHVEECRSRKQVREIDFE